MDIKQDKGAPYIAQYTLKQKKSHQLQRQRNNHSLPLIATKNKQQKVNVLRNQIDQTKNQITILKARINALKLQKQRHDKKKQKHHSQINFINTVRDRLSNDKKYKQNIQQRKEKQLQYLKQQALSMREKMIQDRQMAKSIISEQKESSAEEQRQKRRQDQENIKRIKIIEIAQNQLKAKSIKQIQLQIEQKMKQFNHSRITFGKHNYNHKVEKTLNQKQILEKALKKLKKQQQFMLEQCKKSQANMLSTLYELQSLNPQRKRRNSISSKASTIKQT